jgi:hypothetical protein
METTPEGLPDYRVRPYPPKATTDAFRAGLLHRCCDSPVVEAGVAEHHGWEGKELKVPHVLDRPLVYGVVPAVLTGRGVLASGVPLASAWWVRVLQVVWR